MKKILVIGSLNMDMKISLDNIPRPGETLIASGLEFNQGGKGANQAVAASRLGGNVTMMGSVGNDSNGDLLIENLAKSGVNTKLIKHSASPSGNAIINVEKSGQNSIVVIPGSNLDCDIDYIKANDSEIKNADIILIQHEIPLDAVFYAIERAKELGKIVILNPAPAKEIPEKIYKALDWIIPNETELSAISNLLCDTIEQIKIAANSVLKKGCKNVIVTLGDKGALLCNNDLCEIYSGRQVKAVDTTAAGDTFCGAFAVALSENKNYKDAIEFANRAAAISVTRPGAQSSIPMRTEMDKF